MGTVGTADGRGLDDKTADVDPLRKLAGSGAKGIATDADLQFRTNLKTLARPEDQATLADAAQFNDGLSPAAFAGRDGIFLVLALRSHRSKKFTDRTAETVPLAKERPGGTAVNGRSGLFAGRMVHMWRYSLPANRP